MDAEAPDQDAAIKGAQEWHTANPLQTGVAEDVAKSTAIAVPQTAIGLAGLPGTASDLIGRGVNALGNLVTGKTGSYEEFQKKRAAALGGADIAAPTGQAITGAVEKATGPFYEPKTEPGKLTNVMTQFGLSGGRAGLVPRLASGAGFEAGRMAAEGTPYELPVAIGGALATGVGAGKIGNVLGARRAEKAIAGVTPAGEDLGKIVDQGYSAARNSGVQLAPDAVHGAIRDIRHELANNLDFPVDPTMMKNLDTMLGQAEARFAPKVAPANPLGRMTGVQTTAPVAAPVEFNQLDALRRNIGTIARNKSPEMATEAAAARSAQRQLDSFVESLGTNAPAVISGDATALARTVAEARSNAAAEFRLRDIEALRQRAADSAKNATGVSNYERALRTQVRSFVRPSVRGGISPAEKAGFNAEEIKALRRSIGGTLGTRLLHYGGGLLGGGSGLGGLGAYEVGRESGGGGLGGMALGLTGLLAGRGLRGASNAIARRQAERLGALIASRSPAAVAAQTAAQSSFLPNPAIPGAVLPYSNPAYNPRSVHVPLSLKAALEKPLALSLSTDQSRR
jgi:hypothetical protein